MIKVRRMLSQPHTDSFYVQFSHESFCELLAIIATGGDFALKVFEDNGGENTVDRTAITDERCLSTLVAEIGLTAIEDVGFTTIIEDVGFPLLIEDNGFSTTTEDVGFPLLTEDNGFVAKLLAVAVTITEVGCSSIDVELEVELSRRKVGVKRGFSIKSSFLRSKEGVV